MPTFRIAVLPGDGIGVEVTAEAVRVLGVVAKEGGLGLEQEDGLIGGAAIDSDGSPLPEPTLRICRDADAILFGAVGGPRWDHLARSSGRSEASCASGRSWISTRTSGPRASTPCSWTARRSSGRSSRERISW